MKQVNNQLLKSIYNYLLFFAMVAFLVTCCMMLFVSTLSKSINVTLTTENLNMAAKLTFANVLLLSFLFTVIDAVRRKLTVDRPVKRITDAAEKIVEGDFSVRIPRTAMIGADEKFNDIIDCFNQMAKELSGVETLRSDFIANVSHELKTPLAVIQNYGTLLQEPDLSEEKRREYAVAVTRSSRNLADLITNVLKLNRLENQQIFPQTKEYDLGEQLAECILQFEQVWEEKQIELEIDLAEDVNVRQDMELMSIVWNNLLSNAFKFTEPRGMVKIKLASEGHEAVVSISDTGCGMTPEVGAHIFEKFYQGDTSHATQGNGLGLALVKRIIDITGGSISVSSAVGVGSTFTVRLLKCNEETN